MQPSDHLRRALHLFTDALEQPEPARLAWLRAQCGQDDALLADVLAMLAADAREDDGGDARLAPLASASTPPEPFGPDLVGSRIGAWRVTGVLGHGGMGAVYAVERADGQFRQQAALKRIRIGLDNPLARDRFLRERQILAHLRHPGIAQLLDGGVDAGHAPYFVMERVDGERIDHWCDARALDLRERVRLFLQVLDAVAYAHRNLVVHRDLKPGNILVDASGRIRLMDFGIARLAEDDAPATRTLDRMLTPEFAAPEQLLGEGVGTATDIYQLGVLLFGLLTGGHPHGITGDTPLRRQLALLDRDAGRASALAGKSEPAQALARGGEPAQLSRLLRGDLDAILAHCLQREPDARYVAASALRADLAAWLDGRPVSAREPTLRYRVQRFVQRNRWAAAGTTLAVAAVLAGSGAALWQARQATAQAVRADAVSDYLTGIFTSIDPEEGWGRNVSVRQLLDDGARRLDGGGLAGHPDAEARLRGTLGRTYTALGDYAAGTAQVRKALTLASATASTQVASRLLLGELQQAAGEYADAGATLAALDADLPRLAPGDADSRNRLRAQQSALAATREQPERALALARQAYEDALARHGPRDARTLDHQGAYALRLRDAGKSADAVRLQQALVASLRAGAAPAASQATGLHNLAVLLNDDGRPVDAVPVEQDALRLRQASLPPDHPWLARSTAYLAYLQGQTGDRAGALANFARAVALLQRPAQPDIDALATAHNNWSVACYGFGDVDCTRTHLAQAIALWAKVLPADHGSLLNARNSMAVVLGERGRLAEAETSIRAIIAARQAKHGPNLANAVGLASSYNMLAFNLVGQRRDREAQAAARGALAALEQARVADQAAKASALNALAYAQWASDACGDSLANAERALALATAAGARDRIEAVQATRSRCLALDPRRAAEAERLTRAAMAAHAPGDGWYLAAQATLAEALLSQGKTEDAQAQARLALTTLRADRPWAIAIPRLQRILARR